MQQIKHYLSLFLSFLLVFTLTCSFPITASAATPFTDISGSAYYDAIEYVYNEGIMNGMTSTTFAPGEPITRGMILTILYRISGSDEKYDPDGFSDVPEGRYFYYPIGWAKHYEIASGYDDGTFRPQENITKEQLITFLYRYITSYENLSYTLSHTSLATGLEDYNSIHSYATDAVNWAMNVGILASHFDYLLPRNNASRGMSADYIHRMMVLVLRDAKALALKGVTISTAKEISEYMSDMGFDADYKYDLYGPHMEYAFYNSEMIYTHSHGYDNGTGIALMNGTGISSSQIDEGEMYNAELVYISACFAGGDFCDTLYYTGNAQCVVGFGKEVRAYNNNDGIHQFNRLVFNYLNQSYSIYEAAEEAEKYFSAAEKEYYGINYIEIFGDFG